MGITENKKNTILA